MKLSIFAAALFALSLSSTSFAASQKTIAQLGNCKETVKLSLSLLNQMVKTGDAAGKAILVGKPVMHNAYEMSVGAADHTGLAYKISIFVNGKNRCQILSIAAVSEEN
jgi:hypothetical protein